MGAAAGRIKPSPHGATPNDALRDGIVAALSTAPAELTDTEWELVGRSCRPSDHQPVCRATITAPF